MSHVAKGDCVVNDGTASSPDLRKVPCGPGTYQVLARIPATTDEDTCTAPPRPMSTTCTTSRLDACDYVLCLKKPLNAGDSQV